MTYDNFHHLYYRVVIKNYTHPQYEITTFHENKVESH